MIATYGKLNPWVKRKWVRALRSGEYQQGRGELIEPDWDGGGYCCLGVLVDVAAPEFLVRDQHGAGMVARRGTYSVYGTIPDDLAVTWGLTDEAQDKLVEMNDGGRGFKRIAKWIEDNL